MSKAQALVLEKAFEETNNKKLLKLDHSRIQLGKLNFLPRLAEGIYSGIQGNKGEGGFRC